MTNEPTIDELKELCDELKKQNEKLKADLESVYEKLSLLMMENPSN